MPPRHIVGIDLGTTHTVVAHAGLAAHSQNGTPAPRVFEIEQLVAVGEVAARSMLPSVRYHPIEGELDQTAASLPWNRDHDQDAHRSSNAVLGTLALDLGAKVPGRLVASAKSWLSHGAVDRTAAILPWGAPEEVAKVSPVEASASYLRHVRAAWDRAFPEDALDAQELVLTVPASFDEGARALTLQAAKDAGLPRLRLVEEPQAAFYDFLDAHRDTLEDALRDVRLVLVVDIGGGTTDLTLIRVELRESGPRLTRIAVGEHLMLGGDNMDLLLATRLEPRIAAGAQLGSARFAQLLQQCRAAKERLLGRDAPEKATITVLGTGSKLVGAAKSAEITRTEAHELIVDGFFPRIGPTERPAGRRGGIVEFGLPYVADASVTRHIAAFLARHEDLAREALGDASPPSGELPVPDAVLLNGGVFRADALATRLLETLGDWRGQPLKLLHNDAPDLAVARGAVAYGLARRGVGLRIAGGSPRSYFLALEGAPRRGVCVLPRGAEEGEEVVLENRTFALRLGRPVRFPLVSSTADVRHVRAGDVVDLDDDRYHELPPIAAVLEASTGETSDVPVRLISGLTEVGTLEMSCVSAEHSTQRWKLEFQLRGGSTDGSGAQTPWRVTQLHPRFAEATASVHRVYGKSAQEISPKDVKTLRAELEKILGSRDAWDTPLLRELFGALWAGAKRRRRSADHERIWFNLVGYSLRPGFGYPLDEWRVKQLFSVFDGSVQFAPEAQNWAEWWILWRRVAGGLDASMQKKLLDDVSFYLLPPSPRPRKKPSGPKKLGYEDMVRLVGSLEHIAPQQKSETGEWLLERLTQHGENAQTWWALGRLGARVPFYGSAHNVVSRDVAARWLEHALAASKSTPHAAFAAAMLARASGDRERDLDPELRASVARSLERVEAPATWIAMVRDVTHLEAADERRIFGESLPPGLRLLDA